MSLSEWWLVNVDSCSNYSDQSSLYIINKGMPGINPKRLLILNNKFMIATFFFQFALYVLDNKIIIIVFSYHNYFNIIQDNRVTLLDTWNRFTTSAKYILCTSKKRRHWTYWIIQHNILQPTMQSKIIIDIIKQLR